MANIFELSLLVHMMLDEIKNEGHAQHNFVKCDESVFVFLVMKRIMEILVGWLCEKQILQDLS